jgi:hypothetical protein
MEPRTDLKNVSLTLSIINSLKIYSRGKKLKELLQLYPIIYLIKSIHYEQALKTTT